MKYKNLRFKILFIIISISILSLAAVGIRSYDVQQKLLYKISNEKLMIMMKVIKKSNKDRYRRYKSYLSFIIKEEEFLSLLRTKDTLSLENALVKKYKTFMDADKDFEHFHLYHTDGSLYNINIEKNYNNHLNENIVLQKSMKDKTISKGYVLYNDNGYYYSIVMPVFDNSKILAYLEIGIKADSNIKLASKLGRYKYALYLNNYNNYNQKREIGELMLSNSSIFEEIEIDQEYIYKYTNQNIIINHDSQYYLLNQYDIETSLQKNFAQNILANNVTDFVLENKNRLIVYVVFSIAVLIFMYIVMYVYIGRFIKKLLEDEEKLLIQKDETQLIMDNSENFFLVYENYQLSSVNQPFLYFFNSQNLEVFIEKYSSVELLFEDTNDTFICKYIPNVKWIDELQERAKKERIVAIKNNNNMHYFNIKISTLKDRQSLHIVSFSEVTTLFQDAKKDKYDARHDSLTKVYNRKYFDDLVAAEISRTKKDAYIFSLLMFDIDYFKNVNDTYGHQVGDKVLVHLCNVISENIRTNDIFARWGGEEFILLLSGASKESAMDIAETLRFKIETAEFPTVETITCSIGVSEYIHDETAYSLTSRVDEALYSAKANGRNRVEVT